MPLWPVIVVLAAPSIASVVTYFIRGVWGRYVTLASSVTVLLTSIDVVLKVSSTRYLRIEEYVTPSKDFILDPLASWILLVVSLVYFMISVYCVGFTGREGAHGTLSGRLPLMHSLINVFVLTMLLSSVSNNVFMLWVAIEATTLASAFLVAIHGRAESLEAAWKYVIICSVGLVFSLYGTSLLYAEEGRLIGSNAALWSGLMTSHTRTYSPAITIAFISLLVGYGTKAGLAPMWTWLPDAHAEAPAPASALLSGVLVKCAFIGLIRYLALSVSYGLMIVPKLALALGILSMWVAALFIIVSKDIKRLLAFSTVENVGVAVTGVGFAVATSVVGGLYHVITHGLVKTMMFLLSGILLWIYGTRDIRLMGKLLKIHKVLGALLIIGGFALGYSPPFATFTSSFMVAYGGVLSGNVAAVILYVTAAVVGFAGVVSRVIHITLGKPEPAGTEGCLPEGFKAPKTCLAALIAIAVMITLLGLYMPPPIRIVLTYSAREVMGYG